MANDAKAQRAMLETIRVLRGALLAVQNNDHECELDAKTKGVTGGCAECIIADALTQSAAYAQSSTYVRQKKEDR